VEVKMVSVRSDDDEPAMDEPARVAVAPDRRHTVAAPEVYWEANPLSRPARLFKRTVDLLLAPILLLVTLPVIVAAAVAIRLDSAGPALFRQIRVRSGGRRFVFYKLRTMAVENDESVHQSYIAALIRGSAPAFDGVFKLAADPRITRVGRWIRRFSIDELPQLWNVIRGDMSLIGPRPPLPREVALYDRRSAQRLHLKPGLTGLWQTSGRCQLSFHQMVDLDLDYARSWSPWLDLKILLCTPLALLNRRGAR
jgi:lipopolysaccharide/colanic/teichoic acid biosynthesis glycosyltransferase